MRNYFRQNHFSLGFFRSDFARLNAALNAPLSPVQILFLGLLFGICIGVMIVIPEETFVKWVTL